MAGEKNVIGILALQGCVTFHKKHLDNLGVANRFVRSPDDLAGITGLILPGGESTTMLKLLQRFQMWELLKKKSQEVPFWGICAGAILMAKTVNNPEQDSLRIIDIEVKRNAYGRQLESFVAPVQLDSTQAEAVFIRAPKFTHWGEKVLVKGKTKGEVVFLEEGQHMVTAFHPELMENSWCHKIFLEKISKVRPTFL